MRTMRVIGLTGNIGSGKSTVGGMLETLGARVVDADKVTHQMMAKGSRVFGEIVKQFGPGIINATGHIDRRKLAERVFGDPAAVRQLNGIIHPSLHHAIRSEIERASRDGVRVLVLESPLLFEVDWSLSLLDEVWVAMCPVDTVIKRLAEQRGMSESETRLRLSHQGSSEDKVKRANRVINTNCSKKELQEQVLELWNTLIF
jgi:dephospho-CoA kinase